MNFFKIILHFYNVAVLAEIVALFVGIYKFTRIKDVVYKRFVYFLALTVLVEITGIVATELKKFELNTTIYNNYLTIEFCFYLYLVQSQIRRKIIRKSALWIIVGYGVIGFTNNVLLQGKSDSFSSMSYSLGCFFIISFLLYYFYELMLYPSSTTLKNQPSFWVCSGLLFFYTSTFAVFGLTNFISHLPNIVYNGISIFITITNIVLYSMFSIAFVCQTQIQKSNSLSS